MRNVLLALFMITLGINVVSARQFEDITHNRASITGLLTSSDSWQVELGYNYMICPYVGIGGAVGGWKNYFVDGYASGKDWHIASDDEKPSNIYLRPSIVLKSPAIRIKDSYLGLYAEPGLMMNVPYERVWIDKITNWPQTDYNNKVSTSNGQWCAVDIRLGVYFNVGPCGISAGYMMSNFDIYSQRRHLSYNGVSFSQFYPKKPFMQGAYLTASYYF